MTLRQLMHTQRSSEGEAAKRSRRCSAEICCSTWRGDEEVSGRHLLDAFEDSAVRVEMASCGQRLVVPDGRHSVGEQRLDLRGEDQLLLPARPEQRLDAEAIAACHQQLQTQTADAHALPAVSCSACQRRPPAVCARVCLAFLSSSHSVNANSPLSSCGKSGPCW